MTDDIAKALPIEIMPGTAGTRSGRLVARPHCPECGTRLDGFDPSLSGAGAIPAAGDVTICMYCATILEFTVASTLVVPPAERLALYMEDRKVLAGIRHVRERHRREPKVIAKLKGMK